MPSRPVAARENVLKMQIIGEKARKKNWKKYYDTR